MKPVTLTDYLLYGLKTTLFVIVAAAVIGTLAGLLAVPRVLTIVVAVGVGLILLSRIPPPGARGRPALPSGRRQPGEPFSWTLTAAGTGVPETAERLRRIGLRVESADPSRARLEGGNQFRTRLWGGYFVDPGRLPIAIELETAPNGGLRAEVRDRLGSIAVRNPAFETRYALRVAQIQDALDGYALVGG